jgi:hypothetical protein
VGRHFGVCPLAFSTLHKLPKAANNISENKISQINAKGEIYMKATGIVRRIDE